MNTDSGGGPAHRLAMLERDLDRLGDAQALLARALLALRDLSDADAADRLAGAMAAARDALETELSAAVRRLEGLRAELGVHPDD